MTAKFILKECHTLVEALEHHNRHTPAKTALVMVNSVTNESDNQHLSYALLHTSALHLAQVLQSRFPTGSRILLPTVVSEYFVIAFVACSYAGMVAVPTPLPSQYEHQKQRLSNIVQDAGISAICHAPADQAILAEWTSLEGHKQPLISIEITDICDGENVPVTVASSDLALLQYTSGSTGNPKGVMLTHANLHHNAASFQRALDFSDDTLFGGWIPQYHDMGLMAQVLPSLFLGSTCYMMTPSQFLRRPVFWLQMLSQYGVNHTCAPNFAFDLCRKRVSPEMLEKLDLSCVHYLINGSEPIQADTIYSFCDAFDVAGFSPAAMQPCYGMAECTVFISGSAPRFPKVLEANRQRLQSHQFVPSDPAHESQRLVSCGFAPDYDVQIVDANARQPLAEGVVGDIWLAGGSVGQGYWNNSAATKTNFHNYLVDGKGPYLHTGDIGFVWQGELFITGRSKEVIIVNGKNIYPQDIEHGLRQQFPQLGGKFGAAFGLIQADNRESIGVCHELQGRYTEDALTTLSDQIRHWISREWGAPVSSVALLYPGDIDRTTSGKIQRTKMKERFLEQQLRSRHLWVCEQFLASKAEDQKETMSA